MSQETKRPMPTNVQILDAWMRTEKINNVPNIYDFARKILAIQ